MFRIKYSRHDGFTLVELLAVVAIMILMMALVVPAFTTIGGASNLTQGANLVVDQLNLARQKALSSNRTVEVRFYYLPGPTDGPNATGYRAMRFIVADVYGATNVSPAASGTSAFSAGAQVGDLKKLPDGVIICSDLSSNGKFTTLLPAMSNGTNPSPTWPGAITTNLKGSTGKEFIPSLGTISYAAIQFQPSGATNLDPLGTAASQNGGDRWFLSLKPENKPTMDDRPSNNFVTAQIDPKSGRVKIFRPGI